MGLFLALDQLRFHTRFIGRMLSIEDSAWIFLGRIISWCHFFFSHHAFSIFICRGYTTFNRMWTTTVSYLSYWPAWYESGGGKILCSVAHCRCSSDKPRANGIIQLPYDDKDSRWRINPHHKNATRSRYKWSCVMEIVLKVTRWHFHFRKIGCASKSMMPLLLPSASMTDTLCCKGFDNETLS